MTSQHNDLFYSNSENVFNSQSASEIRSSKEYGRYLVASRDIEALEIIIAESPLIYGPGDDDQDISSSEFPMCLSCNYSVNVNTQCYSFCSKCGWPVCSEKCQQMEIHSAYECAFFTSKSIKYPPPHNWPVINKSIFVLRCLLLKEKNPDIWNTVMMALEHHTERRYKKPHCVKGDDMLLKNLTYFLRAGCQSNRVLTDSEEQLIIRISGIISVNAFSTTNQKATTNSSSSPSATLIAQCIYSTAVLLSNSCVPNCTWRIGPESFDICVRSTVPIKKGQMITIAYNSGDTFFGTLQRQIGNEDVAHFTCSCPRCLDPTELGTFVSAIKCPNCKDNYILPTDPLDVDSRWKCQSQKECQEIQSVHKVVLQICDIQNMFESIKRETARKHALETIQLKKLLLDVSTQLHRNHYILQEIRMQIVKQNIPFLSQMSLQDVDDIIQNIQKLLTTADILTPGFSQIRSILQYFLARCLLQKLKRGYSHDSKSPEDVYKWVHVLETRALLFFNCHKSTQSDSIVKSIQSDLQSLAMT